MELYAPPPRGHGVLDHRQANRTGKKYREETLWDGGRYTRESVNDKGKNYTVRND